MTQNGLKTQPATVKVLKETLHAIDTGNDFMNDTKGTGNETKNKQVRLHQAKASAWQRNHQRTIDSEKVTYGMGGNICKSYTWFATIYNMIRG